METELKFQVPAARREGLRRALATATARTTHLQAVYAETPDLRLAAAGLALRLRKEGRVWVQTLKGRGDGLMARPEHEVRLPPQAGLPVLDPALHAGTPAGELLAAALAAGSGGSQALTPLYRTDVRRLHRRVRHAGAVIEIAYDHGRIAAGDRWVAVDEVEFELISGPGSALPDLARRWAARHGLWWDSRTKAERGLRLALDQHGAPARKASAVPWPADAAASTAQIWCAVLGSALAQALPNAAEIAAGTHAPEHLHQLRVALRRLRVALRLFAPWASDPEAAQELELAWRRPFGQLGAARDADVHAKVLQRALAAAVAPPLQGAVPQSATDAGEVVRGPEFTDLMLRTLSMAIQPGAASEQALDEAAFEVLRRAWRAVRRDLPGFEQASPDRQHRVRKRLKRLRYAIEFLRPLVRRKPAAQLHARVCGALEALGELGDLQGALAWSRAQAESDPQAWFVVGWLAARREQVLAGAMRALARLQRAPRIARRK